MAKPGSSCSKRTKIFFLFSNKRLKKWICGKFQMVRRACFWHVASHIYLTITFGFQDEKDKTYHMYLAEMTKYCGINSWTVNSQVVHSASNSPVGTFKRVEVGLNQSLITDSGKSSFDWETLYL